MKIYISIIATVLALSQACKTKQQAGITPAGAAQTTEAPKTMGKVSHQYRESGCATVIIVQNGEEPLTLIPKEPLPAVLDVDGMKITFDYRLLRMPNPKGCATGIPAEITNVSKK